MRRHYVVSAEFYYGDPVPKMGFVAHGNAQLHLKLIEALANVPTSQMIDAPIDVIEELDTDVEFRIFIWSEVQGQELEELAKAHGARVLFRTTDNEGAQSDFDYGVLFGSLHACRATIVEAIGKEVCFSEDDF